MKKASTTTANTLPPSAQDIRVAGRFKLGKKIGSGAFGDIYLGKISILTDCVAYYFVAEDVIKNTLVAIKIEHSKCAHPQLEYEAKVYKYLAGIRTLDSLLSYSSSSL